MLSFFMASCSDDEEVIPESWYSNYGYMMYEAYPDNNVTPAISATHDARGIHMGVGNFFRPFTLKLRKAVDTDTEFTLGIAQEGENCMPEGALRFLTTDSLGQSTDRMVIPAGKTSISVKVLPAEENAFAFATESREASLWTAPVCIREISNKQVKVSKNRNRVFYSLDVSAYVPNSVSLKATNGSDTSSQKAGTAEDLMEYFGDMQVTLAYTSDKDITVGFTVDYDKLPANVERLPEDAIQFEANGKKLDKNEVVVKAGQTVTNVRCKIINRDFVKGGTYVLPLRIVEATGDEMLVKPEPFFFKIETIALSFEAPAIGSINRYNDYRYFSPDHQDKVFGEWSNIDDGDNWGMIYIPGYPGFDLAIDLKTTKKVTGFMVQGYGGWDSYAVKHADIKVSTDGVAWTTVHNIKDAFPKTGTQYVSFAPIETQYIMLDIKDSYNSGLMYLSEVGVYVM